MVNLSGSVKKEKSFQAGTGLHGRLAGRLTGNRQTGKQQVDRHRSRETFREKSTVQETKSN